MREIRLYGSEGGGAEINRLFLPLSKAVGRMTSCGADHQILMTPGRVTRPTTTWVVGRAVSPKPPNGGAHGVHALPKADGRRAAHQFLMTPGRVTRPTTTSGAGSSRNT